MHENRIPVVRDVHLSDVVRKQGSCRFRNYSQNVEACLRRSVSIIINTYETWIRLRNSQFKSFFEKPDKSTLPDFEINEIFGFDEIGISLVLQESYSSWFHNITDLSSFA